MTLTLDGCGEARTVSYDDGPQSANPFVSLRYHFGMLLGVEDFETEQSYHRGKNRLHNAWLHGEGVVWGFRVSAPTSGGEYRDELEVGPGLALDAAGNELQLPSPHCLDLSDWYEERKKARLLDESAEVEKVDGTTLVKIDARVVARFRSCLTRPVPALMEPCEGSGADTAYSRAYETVDLRLEAVGGAEAEVRPDPYHGLRLLLGLREVRLGDDGEPIDADRLILDRREAILAEADPEERRRLALDAFQRVAAADATALRPGGGDGDLSARYPAADRPPLLLADVMLRLRRPAGETRWRLIEIDVDDGVRPAHVSTRGLQALICALLLGAEGAPALPAASPGGTRPAATTPPAMRADSGRGARVAGEDDELGEGEEVGAAIDTASVALDGNDLTLRATAPLAARSVRPEAFEVHAFDRRRGWVARAVEGADYEARTRRVTLRLAQGSAGEVLRIVARGTGATPILGSDLTPLAGGGGTSGGEGRDFIYMLPTRS